MEARIKKLFHRKKDTSSEAPLQQTQRTNATRSTPALRTSLYDTVPTGEPPQTGSYPIKAENSSAVLQKRISSQRNRGPSDPIQSPFPRNSVSQTHNGTRSINTGLNSTRNDLHPSTGKPIQPYAGRRSEGDGQGYQKQSEIPLSTDFSALSLKPKHSTSRLNQPQVIHTEPTPPFDQTHRGSQKGSEIPTNPSNSEQPILRNTGPIQAIQGGVAFGASEEKKDRSKIQSPYPSHAVYRPRKGSSEDEAKLSRKKSIPRKQISTYPGAQEYTRQSSPVEGQKIPKSSTGSPHLASKVFQGEHQFDDEIIQNNSPDTSKPRSGLEDLRTNKADHIIDKTHTNSVNTEIAEAWAPAVIHETIHQDIHHMREKLITREVHNHDVYHRILPVIDVEVLPPRHFLPVEGGGLVEISADEAPGRGRNWVIAETASKIPSDQAASRGANRFSARNFPGTEGDSKKYITSEGIKTTEETWVHSPDLETGGHDTSQTWPMVFKDTEPQNAQVYGNSKSGKRKSSKMPSASHSVPAERM